MGTREHFSSLAMYLYEEQLAEGRTPAQAKQDVIEVLTQAAQKFSEQGGLEFTGLGIVNPKSILDQTVKLADDLVKLTKMNIHENTKAKQLLVNLKQLQSLLRS